MTRTLRRAPRDEDQVRLSCIHVDCRGERVVVALSALQWLNKQHPELGLDQVIFGLRHDGVRWDSRVSMCIDCACIFPVDTGHRH